MSNLIKEAINLFIMILIYWILFCFVYKIVTLCIGIEYSYIVPTIAFGVYCILVFIQFLLIMKNNKED